MKREDLERIEGMTPEQINEVMRLHGLDVQSANTERATLQTQIDNLQTQLSTAQQGLKAFEGVDVNALQGQIANLNSQLAEQAATFAFEGTLRRAAREAQAVNEDDVIALLPNRDALRKSTNQDADVKTAIEALRTAKPYLFHVEPQDPPADPKPPIVTPKPRAPQGGDPSLDEFLLMSGIQRMELNAKNPALFQQLMQELQARR